MKKNDEKRFSQSICFCRRGPIVAEEGLGVFFGQLGSVYF